MDREAGTGVEEPGRCTDAELVALTRDGRAEAFGELVRRYHSKIYRLARRIADNSEDAEDVTQEAFARAFSSLPSFKGESKFSTWLYRITVNLALMKKRAAKPIFDSIDDPVETRKGTFRRDFPDTSPDPLRALIAKETAGIISEAISGLAAGDREVFVLRHIEGLSTTEASEALNLSVPALKSRLHRSRLALKAGLGRLAREESLLAPA